MLPRIIYQERGRMKDVLFCIGLVCIIFICCIGAFIGAIVGCVVGAVAVPMMILDGKALDPVQSISSVFTNGPQDHI